MNPEDHEPLLYAAENPPAIFLCCPCRWEVDLEDRASLKDVMRIWNEHALQVSTLKNESRIESS